MAKFCISELFISSDSFCFLRSRFFSEFLVSFRAGACDRGLCAQRRGPWPPCCSPSGWSAASSTTTTCWCRVSPGGCWQGLLLMEAAIQTRDLGVWKSSWGQRDLLSHPPPLNYPLGCPSHLQHVLLCPGGQLSNGQGADLPWSRSACPRGQKGPSQALPRICCAWGSRNPEPDRRAFVLVETG